MPETSFDQLAYKPADAARLISVSRARLYELISTGHVPARKIGRRTVILADDLRTYLANLPLYKAAS